MPISWFPGHMHKTGKELRKIMSATHALIEVRDARIPSASTNPLLDELAEDRPVLVILNKRDLADPEHTRAWEEYINSLSRRACISCGPDKQSINEMVLGHLDQLLPRKSTDNQGRKQCLIFGVPNVGKSTLLNAMAGRKLARTGNEPAVTRSLQKIRLNDEWTLVDSPGMMQPRLDDQQAALLLALTGTIRQTAIDMEEIGWLGAEFLLARQPLALCRRYNIQETPNSAEELLEIIAYSVGGLSKKGGVNWARAAESLLNDFRSGKLGPMTLEQVPR